ncbi:MAG: type II secretion system protein [Desulfobacterales bacterium]
MIPLSFIKTKLKYAKRPAKGFTLVELIVTIVLVGIIGTFTTLFLYTGLMGYLRSKDTAEGALKAQIALDRISLELRDIDFIDKNTYTENARIDYTSVTLPGSRKILYDSGVITLDINGIANELLNGVSNFAMKIITPIPPDKDLNADTSNDEVQAIEVSFNIGEIRRLFSTRIFPRNMVQAPS